MVSLYCRMIITIITMAIINTRVPVSLVCECPAGSITAVGKIMGTGKIVLLVPLTGKACRVGLIDMNMVVVGDVGVMDVER